MSKSKNNKKIKHNKTAKHKRSKKRIHKHINKNKNREIILESRTPEEIYQISKNISEKIGENVKFKSYSPSINKELITLRSIPRKELLDCNIENAYKLKEPLKIGIKGKIFGKSCYNYNTSQAKQFLLKNLAADKHVEINKIVPPIQAESNCWFNAMFVTFFVSDKGRKFFHFLRQLMIEGKQKDGSVIPEKLRDAFALLNFAIDACLTGNEYAYVLNTNSVIELIFNSIPDSYKKIYPYIYNIHQSGNPIVYYIGIVTYLNNSAIQLLFIRNTNSKWKDKLIESITQMGYLPHVIVLEIADNNASEFNKKPILFKVNDARYRIDSAVVRDISKQHFCTTITCEGKEMGYDGASFKRLVPLEWKHRMNRDINWQFEGTIDEHNMPIEWNFMKSYQMLIYYRI